MICNVLVENNGDTYKTLASLLDIVPDINKRFIEVIKYKELYSDISDYYFAKGQFDNRLQVDDVNMIRDSLNKTGMNVDVTFELLKDVIPNITKRKIQKIKYNILKE